jgi:hypothetical protein
MKYFHVSDGGQIGQEKFSTTTRLSVSHQNAAS